MKLTWADSLNRTPLREMTKIPNFVPSDEGTKLGGGLPRIASAKWSGHFHPTNRRRSRIIFRAKCASQPTSMSHRTGARPGAAEPGAGEGAQAQHAAPHLVGGVLLWFRPAAGAVLSRGRCSLWGLVPLLVAAWLYTDNHRRSGVAGIICGVLMLLLGLGFVWGAVAIFFAGVLQARPRPRYAVVVTNSYAMESL